MLHNISPSIYPFQILCPFQRKLAQIERIWYQKISKNCMISVKASFEHRWKKLSFESWTNKNEMLPVHIDILLDIHSHVTFIFKKKNYTTQYLHAFSVLRDWISYVYTFVFNAHTVHAMKNWSNNNWLCI